jgi:phage portal protein BeeE
VAGTLCVVGIVSRLQRIDAWMYGVPIEAAGATVAPTPSTALPPNGWGTGITRLAPASMTFAPPLAVWSRSSAMQIPTIARSRNLICTAVGGLPLMLLREDRADPEAEPMRLMPEPWMRRPDPNRTRSHLLAWTCDDLMFHGRAYWRTLTRYASGYPATFMRMAAERVNVHQDGRVTFGTVDVPPGDVVEFLSPIEGLLVTGWYAVATTLKLDQAACRFADNNVPSGWLHQTDGEPMGAEDLIELAAGWDAQRAVNATGALNSSVQYHESQYDPQKLQLTEAREHQALELSRVCSVPPYLVGAPQGAGMTYSNAQQAKQDLYDFGCLPYVTCIEETLSGPNVTPLNQLVRLDVNAWLRDPLTPDVNATPTNTQTPGGTPPVPANVGNGRPRQLDGQNATTGPRP